MQQQVLDVSNSSGDLIIYSATGSGKTIAFALPLLKAMRVQPEVLQAVVIAPSRELVMQIYNVLQPIAVGLKVTCCYGGHKVEDERLSLLVTPGIIVATPGRLLDHVQRGHIDVRNVRWLVLDEFDKALELGFEDEMRRLLRHMPNLSKTMLTSATMLDEIPDYVKLRNPQTLNFLVQAKSEVPRLLVWSVASKSRDKLDTLRQLLLSLPVSRTIVFVNHRDAVERVLRYLLKNHISCGMYHGGMEQIEREKAVAMFRNGSFMVLVATDLASRGLDISEVNHIVHYHLPVSAESFIHRNGRTARVNAPGSAYVLLGPDEDCPDYVTLDDAMELPDEPLRSSIEMAVASLYIDAGRKDKISRGDIVGFLIANGELESSQVGRIDLSDHYAIVA
ncbi:MAG: DEAD/DEAH box helicase, partial [Muribaculaceae bacterium]|nr:DEAD/DEAH box helicase [Muribaculaceae bacterium]